MFTSSFYDCFTTLWLAIFRMCQVLVVFSVLLTAPVTLSSTAKSEMGLSSELFQFFLFSSEERAVLFV